MSLPKPEPGLVFRYDFLWRHEADLGRQTAKERPACIAVATKPSPGKRIVVILPITHSKPNAETVGIEIPAGISRELLLDGERSWIIVSEANVDEWPNPGIAPVPGQRMGSIYGFLPPSFFALVKAKMLRHLIPKRSVRRRCCQWRTRF